MKNVKPKPSAKKGAPPEPVVAKQKIWPWIAGFGAALFAAFEVYQPALRGPFLFDDIYLPFFTPGAADLPLSRWITPIRPLLSLTWWLNLKTSGLNPNTYHSWNVLLHFLGAAFVFAILLKLLARAGETGSRRYLLSGFGACVFLLHPVQTESVAYIASRSETLSVMFFFAAFAIFLWRRKDEISFLESLSVLILFGAACLTKEHTAVLPALLLLTDYFWNPGFSFEGIRRNWRLYLPLVAAGAAGLFFVLRVLRTADTAGFGMKDLPWYQYFFTQCRALWVYFQMFLFPTGQNIDHDYPVSTTVMDHGAIFGLIALIAASAAAWMYRRKYPLASYGFFTALVLFAPTSSFIPIRDTLVERRMYLPLIGLILMSLDLVRRWRPPLTTQVTALAAALIVLGAATVNRNRVWSSSIALWQDSVSKAPNKSRPHFQLAFAHYQEGRCDIAVRHYDRAAELEKPDYRLLLDWALALDCVERPDEAIAKLEQAAALEKTAHVYAQIGMIYGKQGRRQQAMIALDTAASLDPRFDATYAYRGNLFASSKEFDKAAGEYRRALGLNPSNQMAIEGLRMAEQQLRQR
jgi:protein O-mannosyl-transferase